MNRSHQAALLSDRPLLTGKDLLELVQGPVVDIGGYLGSLYEMRSEQVGGQANAILGCLIAMLAAGVGALAVEATAGPGNELALRPAVLGILLFLLGATSLYSAHQRRVSALRSEFSQALELGGYLIRKFR